VGENAVGAKPPQSVPSMTYGKEEKFYLWANRQGLIDFRANGQDTTKNSQVLFVKWKYYSREIKHESSSRSSGKAFIVVISEHSPRVD